MAAGIGALEMMSRNFGRVNAHGGARRKSRAQFSQDYSKELTHEQRSLRCALMDDQFAVRVGSVPVVGDFFDVAWKANRKNAHAGAHLNSRSGKREVR